MHDSNVVFSSDGIAFLKNESAGEIQHIIIMPSFPPEEYDFNVGVFFFLSLP